MNYPIVIHKDAGSDYGVTVPDLPGCFTAGRTLDDALLMAREAIELHLEGLVDAGQVIPPAGQIEHYAADPDYASGFWALVSVDPSSLRLRTRRLNITVPERVLDVLDRFAKRRGETRSGLIVQAVASYVGRAKDAALHGARKGRKRTPRLSKTVAARRSKPRPARRKDR
jgi:predicted RNase H-like HicB family nuclease